MSEAPPGTPDPSDEIIRDLKRKVAEARRRNEEMDREITGLRNSYWEERKAHLAAEADKARLSEALAGLCDWIENEVGAELPFDARAALAGSGSRWRTMDSAPKDGTAFLAFNSRHMAHPPVVVVWDDDRASWRIEATHHEGAQHFNANYFDLWQPLPAAPQQGGE